VKTTVFFVGPLAAIWLVPVLIFAVVFPLAQYQEAQSVEKTDPVVVKVGSRLNDAVQAVDVTLDLQKPPDVESRSAGTVTSVDIAIGDAITSGRQLVSIDGVKVLAYSGAPFYRDLQSGDQGNDVGNLTAFLAGVGALPDQNRGTNFNSTVVKAVKSLQRSLGAPQDGVFRLAYVAYLPAASLTVGTLAATVGDDISSGEQIFVARGTPVTAKLTLAGSSDPVIAAQGPLLLKVGEKNVEVQSTALSDTERESAYRLLDASATQGTITAEVDQSGSHVVYSGALLTAASPATVGVVPSSALYVTRGAATCLFAVRKSGNSASYRPMPAGDPQLVVGEISELSVADAFVGLTIVRNPTVLPPEVQHRCK